MTEVEMCKVLGLLAEPVENHVQVDPFLQMELLALNYIFSIASHQKRDYGPVNPDMWCEFVPWHSLN